MAKTETLVQETVKGELNNEAVPLNRLTKKGFFILLGLGLLINRNKKVFQAFCCRTEMTMHNKVAKTKSQ